MKQPAVIHFLGVKIQWLSQSLEVAWAQSHKGFEDVCHAVGSLQGRAPVGVWR